MAVSSDPRFLDRTTPPHIATLVLAAGIGALSLNIILPSLPSIAAHYDVPYASVQLTVSLYLAATAVLQFLIGPLSDRYGRRPVLMAGLAVFVVASAAAAFAPTFGIFMACRLIQAVVSSGFALSRAVVRDRFGQDQSASMIGYVTMGMSLVPMLAPAIGGVLEEGFGWQATFGFMTLSGLAILALVWADMGETAPLSGGSLRDQVRQYPELITSQRFWGYNLASAFSAGAFFAYLGGAPLVGTDHFGLSAAELGFYFGAPAVGYLFGNWISARQSVRRGVNQMVFFGSVAVSIGMGALVLMILLGDISHYVFFGMMTFVGLGNGLVLPNAAAGMLSVRPKLAGSASGLGGAFMVGGGAALSTIAGAVVYPGSGPLPLILTMFLSSCAGALAAIWVIWRARRVDGAV